MPQPTNLAIGLMSVFTTPKITATSTTVPTVAPARCGDHVEISGMKMVLSHTASADPASGRRGRGHV